MSHRTGRKPIREIIYELVKIQEVVQSESSLTNIQVVERCFEPQCKSYVVGLGAGITAKELKGGNSSKTALLEMSNATEKENESLKGRMEGLESKYDVLESKYDVLESKYAQLASVVFDQTSSPSSIEQYIEAFNRSNI
ncbi:uncharacterized protein [Nicotiana sylvestris]|uniref:Uncharacterized protein isoform X2 n=2 Tax=Nicotiana TaxID=4085 RepID=A0A1S4AUP2_TOBAC|nr:PREDICTED: uncharacterized protein LOC104227498 [Nicotiana sylvestris]XP_016480223.1 PREDICTED: uncharacterized protein LOC107801408 isoform X2 [Nicotiana tabacum]